MPQAYVEQKQLTKRTVCGSCYYRHFPNAKAANSIYLILCNP